MNPEKHDYELTGVEHELVSKYHPKFLAKGGEHIAYDVSDHPDIVVKVKTEPIKRLLEWNIEHKQPIDSLSAEVEPRIHEYLREEAARHQQLKKYFGSEHVPNQREYLVKIPITEDILNALYEGKPPAVTDEMWAVVMIQKRIEAMIDPERLAIVAGYAEQQDVPEDLYRQVTRHLIFGDSPEQRLRKDQFLEIQSHNDLRSLVEKSAEDENLRKTLGDLVAKIISYVKDTREIFDFAGQDNIVLFQKDGEWNYVLIDTQYPDEGKMVDKAKDVLLKLSTGTEIDAHEKNILLNTFNFVRTVNGLAEQIGILDRINIVPEGMKAGNIDFLKIIR